MTATDFAVLITKFLTEYLPLHRNCSKNTISSYKDSLKLFILFLRDVVKGTSKYMYVSNPSRGGGLHNYGLAVDISIADSLGHPLPMGTEVDYMDAASHITNEAKLVREGKITQQERENRILLRQVMKSAGFRALPSEWWHFNLCSRDEAKQKYKLIN